MKRENARPITEEEFIPLNTISDIIVFLMKCYREGKNVYYETSEGIRVYSCDGYSFDEYYLMMIGVKYKDKRCFDELMFGSDRDAREISQLGDLLLPALNYLKSIYKPLRDELIMGRINKTK